MKTVFRSALTLLWLTLVVALVSAQAACPDVVNDAMSHVERLCSGIGRNQICYGNVTLVAQPQAGVADLHFASPGDMEELTRIQSLTLSSMNQASSEWGISIMSLQASIPGVMPGQSVTFVLFGNVGIARDDATAAAQGYGNGMQAFTFSTGIGDAQCGEAPDSGILVQTRRGNAQVELSANGVEIVLGSTAYIESTPGGQMVIYLVEGKATVSAFGVSRVLPAGTLVTVPIGGDNHAVAPPSEVQGYNPGVVGRLTPMLPALPRRIGLAAALDLSACTLIPPANANTRQGPGTEFRRGTRLAASTPAQATGVATDAIGARWYQVTSGNWVREDVVNTYGPCAALPVVQQQPAVTNNTPTQSTNWIWTETILENNCAQPNDPLPVGHVTVSFPTLTLNADGSVLTVDWGGGTATTLARAGDNVYVNNNPFGFQATMTVTFTSATTLDETWLATFGQNCVFSHHTTGVINGG